MNQDRFIEDRKLSWDTLESLSGRASGNGISRMTAPEIRLLGNLYLKASSDLSYARSKGYDGELTSYLNTLVRKAYRAIYLKEKGQSPDLWTFLSKDYPALVRKNIRYILLAVLVHYAAVYIGFMWGVSDTSFVRRVSPAVFLEIWDRENSIGNENTDENTADDGLNSFPALSTWYLVHNFKVGLYCFGTGIFLGLGTLYFLIYNGLVFGAIWALTLNYGYSADLFNFVVPHYFLEDWAVLICGGAGFMIAGAIIFPGELSLKDSIRTVGADAVRLAVGTAPLFLLAGIIEASFSRFDYPTSYKLLFGLSTVILMLWYFSLGYRSERKKKYHVKEENLEKS